MEVTKRLKTSNKSHMKSAEIDEMNSSPIDHFQKLPNEVLQHILSYLPYEEVDNLRLTIDIARRVLGLTVEEAPLGYLCINVRTGHYSQTTLIVALCYPHLFDDAENIRSIYVPVLDGSEPCEKTQPSFRRFEWRQFYSAMALDMLTCMWTNGVVGLDKYRRSHSNVNGTIQVGLNCLCTKLISVAKPEQKTDVQ